MITVTNTNDSGAGSFRQAVIDAQIGGDDIDFAVVGTIVLTSGSITIISPVNILGPGSGVLTISGNNASKIFNLQTGVHTISGLTLADGSDSFGGGIYNGGTLTLNDIVIRDCVSPDQGGGLANASTINGTDVTIQNCSATDEGGGFWSDSTDDYTNLTIDGCTAGNKGGGAYSEGTFTHDGGEITGCTATDGAGVYNQGTYEPTEVTFSDNIGNAIYNNLSTTELIRCTISGNSDGGVHNGTGGTLNSDNSTISGNTGDYAITLGTGAALDLKHSTITSNAAGGVNAGDTSSINIQNTILAGNTGIDLNNTALTTVISGGYNLFGSVTVAITPGTDDQFGLNFAALVIGPLQDNGGPTFTHALLAGSPALNSGTNVAAPPTDQRGEPRVVAGTIDIGAYESQSAPTECLTITGSLPAWLTKQDNCLVVVPGSFRGNTKAEANAAARAALDAWVAAALASGDMVCSGSIVECPPVTSPGIVETITTDANTQFLLGIAYAPNDDRIFVAEYGRLTAGLNMRVFVIDPATNTVTNTIEIPNSSNGLADMRYGSAQDKIYVINNGISSTQSIVVIDPTTLAIDAAVTLSAPPDVFSMTYDVTRDMLYLATVTGVGTNQLRQFNCATLAEGLFVTSGNTNSLRCVYCPINDKIYWATISNIHVVDPDTMTIDTTILLPTGSCIYAGAGAIFYSALSEKIHANNYACQQGLHVIDPGTNTVINSQNPGSRLRGLADNLCRSEIVYGMNADLFQVNPATYALGTSVSSPSDTSHMVYCPTNVCVYVATESNRVVVLG